MKLIYKRFRGSNVYVTDFKQVSNGVWEWNWSVDSEDAAEFTLLEIQLILQYITPPNGNRFTYSCLSENQKNGAFRAES